MYTIYSITGKNNKYYIGQTILDPPEKRFYWHIWKSKNNLDNNRFANALGKHGRDYFTFTPIAKVKTKEEADNLERLWITITRSYDSSFGYNSTFGGEGVRATEETKKKIGEANRGSKSGLFDQNLKTEDVLREYEDCHNFSEVARRLNTCKQTASRRYYKERPEEIKNRSTRTWKHSLNFKSYMFDDSVSTEAIIKEYQDCKSFAEVGRRLKISQALAFKRYRKIFPKDKNEVSFKYPSLTPS